MGANDYSARINLSASLDPSNIIKELQKVQAQIEEINKETSKTQSASTKEYYRDFTQQMAQLLQKQEELKSRFGDKGLTSQADVQNFAALNKEINSLIKGAASASHSFLSSGDFQKTAGQLRQQVSEIIEAGVGGLEEKIRAVSNPLSGKVADVFGAALREGFSQGTVNVNDIIGRLQDELTRLQPNQQAYTDATKQIEALLQEQQKLNEQSTQLSEQEASSKAKVVELDKEIVSLEQQIENARAQKAADPAVQAAQSVLTRLGENRANAAKEYMMSPLSAGIQTRIETAASKIKGATPEQIEKVADALKRLIQSAVANAASLEEAQRTLATKKANIGGLQELYPNHQGSWYTASQLRINSRSLQSILNQALGESPSYQIAQAKTARSAASEQYDAQIRELTQKLREYGQQMDAAKAAESDLTAERKKVDRALRDNEKQIEQAKVTQTKNAPSAEQATAVQGAINILNTGTAQTGIDNINTKLLEVQTNANNINQKAQEADSTTQKVASDVKVLSSEQKKFEQEAAKTAKTFSSINKTFDRLMYTFERMFSIFTIYTKLSQVIKKTFQDVQAIDKAYGSIAMVTSKTVGEMWTTYSQYADIANRLGQTTESAIKTSALFYQQGLKEVEVLSLTESTMKLATLAGQDFETSTKQLTAALRAFHMEMDQGEHITDVYSELAAHAAADVKGIAYAMSKTASIAASAGASFENTAAFITQMIN